QRYLVIGQPLQTLRQLHLESHAIRENNTTRMVRRRNIFQGIEREEATPHADGRLEDYFRRSDDEDEPGIREELSERGHPIPVRRRLQNQWTPLLYDGYPTDELEEEIAPTPLLLRCKIARVSEIQSLG